jgi:hypothetical protein
MQDVFAVYPDINTIYVVDGMPFLNESDAQNHSAHTGAEVEVVRRDEAGKPAPNAATEQPVKTKTAKAKT